MYTRIVGCLFALLLTGCGGSDSSGSGSPNSPVEQPPQEQPPTSQPDPIDCSIIEIQGIPYEYFKKRERNVETWVFNMGSNPYGYKTTEEHFRKECADYSQKIVSEGRFYDSDTDEIITGYFVEKRRIIAKDIIAEYPYYHGGWYADQETPTKEEYYCRIENFDVQLNDCIKVDLLSKIEHKTAIGYFKLDNGNYNTYSVSNPDNKDTLTYHYAMLEGNLSHNVGDPAYISKDINNIIVSATWVNENKYLKTFSYPMNSEISNCIYFDGEGNEDFVLSDCSNQPELEEYYDSIYLKWD
ncbi:hypothetical protein BCT06_18165 [Vibrio breoganii]|uniref:hypothetical protein n=1 Tax=Vibrio breoganii TaxID=553239 RepID=UPI000C82EF82|nr:hypothetical protein [Vibrio breoganii]PMO53523.1 hypothetical protein BCT06_18165 [Vibrio breoganii]